MRTELLSRESTRGEVVSFSSTVQCAFVLQTALSLGRAVRVGHECQAPASEEDRTSLPPQGTSIPVYIAVVVYSVCYLLCECARLCILRVYSVHQGEYRNEETKCPPHCALVTGDTCTSYLASPSRASRSSVFSDFARHYTFAAQTHHRFATCFSFDFCF